MLPPDRRGFLGTAAGGLAALLAGPSALPAADPPNSAFSLDTLFLTWHRDPTTTMVVQWIADPATVPDPTIWVAGGLDILWTPAGVTTCRPFPLTDLCVFRTELTGLKPGTEYRFRVGKRSLTYKFRTMPAKATNTFTFVSGGDCGVNPHTVANNKIAAKQDPYFALIGGDLGYDNGTDPKVALAFIRNYASTMIDTKGRLIPLVVCIGNHEVAGGFGKSLKDAPYFAALFDGLYHETSYATLDFGDYLSLVLLDSGHAAKIDGEQTDWLDKALKDRAGRTHLIGVNHVPCYPSFRPAEVKDAKPGSGTGELQRKHWVPLFEKRKVDFVLEHHDHTYKRTHPLLGGKKDKKGILYLGDGSWGMLRTVSKPETRDYLMTASTAYHLSVHRLEDEDRFHLAIDENGKIVDVCRTGKKERDKRTS